MRIIFEGFYTFWWLCRPHILIHSNHIMTNINKGQDSLFIGYISPFFTSLCVYLPFFLIHRQHFQISYKYPYLFLHSWTSVCLFFFFFLRFSNNHEISCQQQGLKRRLCRWRRWEHHSHLLLWQGEPRCSHQTAGQSWTGTEKYERRRKY